MPMTTLIVALVDVFGTRFVFPFVCDEGDAVVPFSLDVTNPLFVHKRHDGRNFFTIEVDPPKEGGAVPMFLGKLFVSAGGYNLSIVLSTTTVLREHVSDYLFELTEEASEDLIQQAIKKRTRGLEEAYKEKRASLDREAEIIALRKVGMLAMGSPDVKAIKEESQLDLPTGERVLVYLSEMMTFGNKFHVLAYEVTNDTADILRVTDVGLFAADKGGVLQKLTVSNSIMPRIEVGETVRGVVATDSLSINDGARIKLSLVTSQGNVDVSW